MATYDYIAPRSAARNFNHPPLPPRGTRNMSEEFIPLAYPGTTELPFKKANNKKPCFRKCCWILLICISISIFLTVYYLPALRGQWRCSSGYTWNPATKYCYKSSPVRVNFEKAQHQCATDDAEIASLHSEAESEFVIALYKNSLAEYRRTTDVHLDRSDLWLGLVHNKEESQWAWTDGSKVDHTKWAEGEPNMMDRKQHFTKMVLDKLPGYSPNGNRWNNVGEYDANAVVCKKTDITTIRTTTTTTSTTTPRTTSTTTTTTATPTTTTVSTATEESEKCDLDYKWFKDTKHCYKCVLEVTDFENARNHCFSDGGDLASIHSFDENHFITQLYFETWKTYKPAANIEKAGIDIWIGLRYNELNSAWEWTDGSVMNMMRWAPAEPNKMDKEFWGEMRPSLYKSSDSPGSPGNWNNLLKEEKRGFVCKKSDLKTL